MEAATAAKPEPIGNLIPKRPEYAQFASVRSNLRLVLTSIQPLWGPAGQKTGETTGRCVPFTDGIFRCPHEGQVVLEKGVRADAAQVLKEMREHLLIGDSGGGFFEVQPTAPSPTKAELDALVRAATDLDAQGLADLIAAEESGWGREELLDIARGSLDRVNAVLEGQEAAVERIREEERAKVRAEAEQAKPKAQKQG